MLTPLSLSPSCRRPVQLHEWSPGTVSVGWRGRVRPHHAGGRRQSGAIANPGLADIAKQGPGVGHMPSKTSRLQPAPLIGQALCRRVYSHWNLSWLHIRNCVIYPLTSHWLQVGWLWYHGQYHSWYHRPMISENTDILDSELWYHSLDSMMSCMISYMILHMIS